MKRRPAPREEKQKREEASVGRVASYVPTMVG
jgi:hypothetical protein